MRKVAVLALAAAVVSALSVALLLSETPIDGPFVEQPDVPEKPGVSGTGTDNPDYRPFVTTWRTTSPDESITIPVGGATGTYTVDWGDGSVSADITGDQTHTYADAGEYVVSISGGFTRIHLYENSTSAAKLTSIDQWGDAKWGSMERAFSHASNMEHHADDMPDLSSVTSMAGMFSMAYSFKGDISGWDVSGVRDMSGLFRHASAFNGDISNWDVSSVEDMNSMFRSANYFNGDISGWDVSSVEDMRHMFRHAWHFKDDLSSWNMSSVITTVDMFAGATAFDSDIPSWDVSNAKDMRGMFSGASSFDGDVSAWDVSSVVDMSAMFSGASSFDGDVSAWDVSNVRDMSGMFINSAFNGDVSGWNVSGVKYMNGMFSAAKFFNGDVSNWDVSGVKAMRGMFDKTPYFDGNPEPLGTHNSVPQGAPSLAQNFGKWYIVPDGTTIDGATGIVGRISAQNGYLDGQNPRYSIGPGGDSGYFEIVDGNTLRIKDVADIQEKHSYSVNVTSAGGYGTGNFRVLEVTGMG